MTTETTAAAPAPAAGTPGVAAPAPATPVIQAPAPAAPAAGLSLPEPAAAKTEEVIVQYEPTDDPGLDLALDFIGRHGLGPEHPAVAAAIEGKFDQLKGHFGAMGDKAKGWEKYVALAEKAYAATSEKQTAQQAKDAAAIHAVVGGKDQWEVIAKWAGENAEPEERKQVNAALNAGGAQAKAMAAYLLQCFEKASGTRIEPKSAIKDGASPSASNAGPLDAKAYGRAVAAGYQKHGPAFEHSAEYKTLQARRTAGMARG